MAANIGKRRTQSGYYQQLNESISWFLEPVNTKKRRKKACGPYYPVERIITKKNVKGNTEYLIKWEGYSSYYCSWEDEESLTKNLLKTYDKPIINQTRLQSNIDNLCNSILAKLKSKSRAPISFNFDHDCFRFLFGNKGNISRDGKAFMLGREDFTDCHFFNNWDQALDKNGDGLVIQFPIRVGLVLSFSAHTIVCLDGKLIKQPRMPIEKLKIDFVCKPYSATLSS